MTDRYLTTKQLQSFRNYLLLEEKSPITVEKYLRDTHAFERYAQGRPITKELTVSYKASLQKQQYAIASINSMLAALNCLLTFLGWSDCKIKSLRQQRQAYCAEETELTKAEYLRLLEASKGRQQLNLIIQTICCTGIRVSELKYFSVEAVSDGEVTVRCKSKTRRIFVPKKLKTQLLAFARKHGISCGTIFITRNGLPLDRSNLWAQMKQLCVAAKVAPAKVFPHNLRKLFARTFYSMEKDIAKLADILGHSNINTTRIYIMTPGAEHRRKIERLGLII